MCSTCGCSDPNKNFTLSSLNVPSELFGRNSYSPSLENHKHPHDHNHGHDHGHHHDHDHGHHHHDHHGHDHDHDHDHSNPTDNQTEHGHGAKIDLETDILSQNNLLAQRNRGYFDAKNILSLNMMSAPGSGKTSLLERTLQELKNEMSFYVIEGDQQTMNDAERIASTGIPVIQINTGNGCHLDAQMINEAIKQLKVNDHSVVVIENVGNLVCPSLFDLGESKRIVIISVTEGEDKPLKYPTIFQNADLCILNKTDLLPYLDINVSKIRENALRINHHLEFIELSVKTGTGMDDWYHWLQKNKNAVSEYI
jgi:hydrogenase nickel incorporation protein HypB